MNAPFRTPQGGRVDRDAVYTFTFNDREYAGHPGDTLASALLANGVHQVTTSIKLGRPRGFTAAWAEDTGGLVQVEHPFPEPMLLATTVELFDGLVARGIPGQGRLAEVPDTATYDATHVHTDVLIAGAGPAGLAAALTAARAGARVVLIDEQSEAGGALLGSTDTIDGRAALDWVAGAVAELATFPDVLHLQRTTAFGHYDDGFILAVQRRTDHLGAEAPAAISRQRVWRIRARRIIIAAGAHERPVVFTDNDRPGIMLAHGARTFLHRYGVTVGAQAVVFTTNDSAYLAALDLHDAGVRINAIVDVRSDVPVDLREACATRGIDIHTESVISGTHGDDRVTHALVSHTGSAASQPVPCDALLVSGGWNPAVHLYSQARGTLRYDDGLGAFVPDAALDGVSVVGSADGVFDLPGCLRSGREAAAAAIADLGLIGTPEPIVGESDSVRDAAAGAVVWRVAGVSGAARQFVDVQRDATVADLVRAVGAGMRSMEHIKRYTTIGTAHDQGKTSGVVASGITAELLGVPVQSLGVTTFRAPYTPVGFATLAGRNRGRRFDPERVTAVHDWHVARGAVFEDVGQWKRPRYYPEPGEDMETAVLRECAAVRRGVGILDGSTLGKIDVQGPDAAQFLDLLYTNMMSTLKVGMLRYGVMCGVDGMVIDDGTVMRLADDRFQAFTTTGGAAKILDWMEEWLQTEWPHLRVRLTSVTEQWHTFPVAGPKSRDVIGAVFPDVDVSNDAFPFMAWRDTRLDRGREEHKKDGVHVRIGRVSFSGELAYEVNVMGWYAAAVWEKLIAAGARYGITPYGTETMHVLRAEKGYPIIGQDTDGTVTPQDLGMSWAVSKKKPDFIGKRSFTRSENLNPLRKQFVGLLPTDAETVLPEGSQIIEHTADGVLPPPPVPMLGHVTSSYRSAELGRPFALALVKGGHARIGDTLHVPVDGTLVPVEVTGSVLVDPEGARRDG